MFKLAYAAFDRETGRPVFEDFGLVHVQMLGGESVFVKDPTGKFLPGIKPSFSNTLLAELGPADTTNWVVFDLESFPMVLGATTARLTERQALYMQIYDIAHATLPQAKFATYGDTGVENLHYSFTPATRAARLSHYQQWLPPIWSKAQGLVSHAYTLDDTFSHWEKVVRANIEDARILEPNKPHFIFLKPRFNVHNPDFANDPIPYSIWLSQLEFLASILLDKDYVVVWEGQVAAWTQFAEENWWKATKDFLAASAPRSIPPPHPTTSGLTATCEESLAESRAETAAIQAQLAEVEAAHAIAVDGLQDTIDSLNASLDVSNAKLESIRLVLDS